LPSLRASDADRDQAAAQLRKATVEGRLNGQELEERLEALFASRTYGELDRLLADLPVDRSLSGPPARARASIGAIAAAVLVVATLGMLALMRARSAVAVVGPRARQVRVSPFPDPHHALVVATSMFGVFATLVVCAAVAWALTRRSGSRHV
jgi:Domain of unknown function (DUF1707)